VDYAFPAHFVERVVDIKEFDSLSYGERGNGFHMDGGFVPLFDGTEFLRRSSAPSGAQERESAALFPNTQPPSAEALAGPSDHHARLRKRSAVVVEWAGQAFGFVVDRVKGRQRVHSVKLNGLVQGEGIYSGMTIFHDGRPGLVVDVHALARQAGASNRGVA
jgi:chemotaxis protein histidine kinase CheA